MPRRLRFWLLLFLPVSLAAQGHAPPRKLEVAEGIFLFMTPPYSDVGLDGNSIAIVSNDGVLVFDANGTPAAAEAVLAEIRQLTSQPVRYVVLSHWHWDHWYGAEVYRKAFPDIEIITQAKTREMMMGPALTFNQPGIESQLPGHIADVAHALSTAESAHTAPAELARLRRHLEEDRFFLEQKRNVHHTYATLTYVDSLTIYLGERVIRVLHYDRAVTPGDTFIYLPTEKVLLTGDLLVNPISFALDAYPTGWLHTLQKMDSLNVSVIVPGHGEPLHDKGLLETDIAILAALLREGREARAAGLNVEQARAAAESHLHDLRVKVTHDDPTLNQEFDGYLVDWFLHRVYEELDAPLSDEIEAIPSH
jgi:cyclase